MKTKIISILCTITLLFSTINVAIIADNVTQNSTPSTNTNISDGEDFTQGETTIYSDVVGSDKNEASDVYVSQASTFAAMIPKVIILDGHGGNATYEVYAKGNIGGTENVYIVPQSIFQLNDVKNIKHSLEGNVFQNKTAFSWNDVMNEQKSTSQGNIIVPNISAGNWSGSFNFNIYLQDTIVRVGEILLSDTSIIDEETNAIQVSSTQEEQVPISIYPATIADNVKVYSSSPYVMATISEDTSPIASLSDTLFLTKTILAEDNNSFKKMKLSIIVSDDAPCELNANITIKSRTKSLIVPIIVKHKYDNGVVIKASTCIDEGIKQYTCERCNKQKNEIAPKFGHNIVNNVCTLCGTMVATTFAYTGTIKEFIAPTNGVYQLEVWGGKGGKDDGYWGGNGGYAKGEIILEKGQSIFICVGGAGSNDVKGAGGYNGGGGAGSTGTSGSGAGATSITTTNRGILKNFDTYRDEVLIVAGGGGGGGYRSPQTGGAGGGTNGSSAGGAGGTQTTGYAFGLGQTRVGDGPGGGGGWYGGKVVGDNGGGGGSGYIGGVSNGTMSNGVRAGHGQATIKLIR